MLFEPRVRELSFTHGSDRLVGDVAVPPSPGPHPAVVFVEGSGSGGRDQGPWPTRFAAAGFASFAFDKPGCGSSTGDWRRQDLGDRVQETVAAVRALAEQPDIRADAIALFGTSQGGWVSHLAPAVADGAIAAVVTVSGPGVSVLAQEEYRLRHHLPAEGCSAEDVESALTALHDQVDRIRAGEDPAAVHAAQAAWHDTGWYRLMPGQTPETIAFVTRIIDHDPIPALATVGCPFLGVFGADDLLVPVDESVAAITDALTRAGHEDHELVVFPDADHSIRVYTGDGPPRVVGGHYEPGQAAPGYPEYVVTWLHQRLG